jgi:hypothetical protein
MTTEELEAIKALREIPAGDRAQRMLVRADELATSLDHPLPVIHRVLFTR